MLSMLDMKMDGIEPPVIQPDYQLNELVAVAAEGGPWKEGQMVECEPDFRHFPRTGVIWKFLVAIVEKPETNGPVVPGQDGGDHISAPTKVRKMRGTLFIEAHDTDNASNSALLYPNVRRVG